MFGYGDVRYLRKGMWRAPKGYTMSKWRNIYECLDCDVDTTQINEYYAVKDKIWYSVMVGFESYALCIGCLERRLGRQLTRRDFKKAPVNNPDDPFFKANPQYHHKFSERFLDRLGYPRR